MWCGQRRAEGEDVAVGVGEDEVAEAVELVGGFGADGGPALANEGAVVVDLFCDDDDRAAADGALPDVVRAEIDLDLAEADPGVVFIAEVFREAEDVAVEGERGGDVGDLKDGDGAGGLHDGSIAGRICMLLGRLGVSGSALSVVYLSTMNANKALWEKGDFTAIASLMRDSGATVARSLGVEPGMKVLDLGCGDGTTAVPMAQMGATVRGIDIASNLVAAGNRRAAELGLSNVTFEEGDACLLEGVADGSFDLSVSFFGAMFAPKPFDVAKEMVRVTKPGGRVVMGNWIPGDPTFVAQVLKISSAFTPPPPDGFISPMLWGVEANIVERFVAAGVPADNVSMERDTFRFVTPGVSPEEFIDLFRQFYGPTMNAFEAAEKNGKVDEIRGQLIELAKAQNKAEVGTDISATFMRVTVKV